MNIDQYLDQLSAPTDADSVRLILGKLPGETHREKFAYLIKLMHDRETFKSEIATAESIARQVIEENKGLKNDFEDIRAQVEVLEIAIINAANLLTEMDGGYAVGESSIRDAVISLRECLPDTETDKP